MSTDIWVCEYSPTQGCFHIDTLDAILSINRQGAASGIAADYIPLYMIPETPKRASRRTYENHCFQLYSRARTKSEQKKPAQN